MSIPILNSATILKVFYKLSTTIGGNTKNFDNYDRHDVVIFQNHLILFVCETLYVKRALCWKNLFGTFNFNQISFKDTHSSRFEFLNHCTISYLLLETT